MPSKQLTITELFGHSNETKKATHQPKSKSKNYRTSSPSILYKNPKTDTNFPFASSSTKNLDSSPICQANTKQTTETASSLPLPDNSNHLDDVFTYLTEPSWRSLLEFELKKNYIKNISYFLKCQDNEGAIIFPPRNLIFNAFNLTPFHDIRVVLIGQDPYHNWSQAHGLCFSVPKGVPFPPSLKNIFKELSSDYPEFKVPDDNNGSLESWARQGVFLLNATMTVEAHKANSHSHIGWQKFTDAVIKLISKKSDNGIVFILWGAFAHCKEALVDKRKHRVVKAAHPSPLSAYKFFGCKCFTKTNALLKELGREPINWISISSSDTVKGETNKNINAKN